MMSGNGIPIAQSKIPLMKLPNIELLNPETQTGKQSSSEVRRNIQGTDGFAVNSFI